MPWMSNSTYEEQIEQHGSLIYTNVGDSMLPLMREHRDLLIIEKRPEGRCKKFDIVLYRRPSGKHILHRIIKVRKDDYIIAGDNRWEREIGVKDEWIFGVLTGIVRDGKKIDLKGWKYRLYVFAWCDLFWVRAFILWLFDFPRWFRRQKDKYEARKQR
jgi:hypothetical protein